MLYTCITNTLIREENETGVECLPIYSHIIAVCLNFGIALSTVLLNFGNILLNIRKQNILLYKPWKQLMKRINQEKPLPLKQQILMILIKRLHITQKDTSINFSIKSQILVLKIILNIKTPIITKWKFIDVAVLANKNPLRLI